MSLQNALRILILIAGWSAAVLTTAWAAEEAPVNPLVLAAREGVVGMPAPALQLTTIDGETIDLGGLYGTSVVYLKFWATWCIPCRQQMPHFENVYQHAGDDLAVIAVNVGFNDSLPDILKLREDLDIHMPIVVDDGALAGVFNLRVTPQHVVIGKDGVVKHIGNKADAQLDALIEMERAAPDVPAAAVRRTLAALPHPGAGDQLPAATLHFGADGIDLRDRTAGGTVMVFMIPWCESYLGSSRPRQGEVCRQVREQVETLKQQYADLRWLGVSSGLWTMPADLPEYIKDYKVTLPLALDADGRLFRGFGVMTVPTLIVADNKNRILLRSEGYDPSLAQTLSRLAAGR